MQKKKILILEDELLIAKMYSLIFEKEGFSVCMSDSVTDIIALVNSQLPDYIIMDNQLKNKQSGFEAALLLRESGNLTPIIFTTGNAENIAKNFVTQVTNSSYKIKPIDGQELMEFIQHHLNNGLQ
jgi:DNA-binding response OmpR family regulator